MKTACLVAGALAADLSIIAIATVLANTTAHIPNAGQIKKQT